MLGSCLRLLTSALLAFSCHAYSNDENKIEIAINVGYGKQRALINRTINEFRAQHPAIDLRARFTGDVGTYVELVHQWIEKGEGPDVIFWYGGKRIAQFAREERLNDLSPFWREHELGREYPESVQAAVTIDERVYAVPITYYFYGLYYRASTFYEHDISLPTTWPELIHACRAFREKGIDLFAMGTKTPWITHGWFDYLSLRLYGLAFHQQLLDGDVAYTDERVLNVLRHWKQLLDNDCFNSNHARYDNWQAFPRVLHKLSAMMLSDGALPQGLPAKVTKDIYLTDFPRLTDSMPAYTVAPINVFMVPKYAELSEPLLALLNLLSSAKFQSEFNYAISRPPARIDAHKHTNRLTRDMLAKLESSPGGIQFFDRDTEIQFAKNSHTSFVSFLQHRDPQRCAEELEALRGDVFGVRP